MDSTKNIWDIIESGVLVGFILAAECAGIAMFCYLLYQLIKLIRPKKVRQEEQRLLSHRLYPVSGRGRIAYLILCLEETLRFYEQDGSAWEWMLRQLWTITTGSEQNWIDQWIDSVEELLPSVVLSNDAPPSPPAEIREIRKAYTLYQQAEVAMIVINAIMENTYTIVCEWESDAVVI